jgi:hypothetical protein
MKKSTTTPQSPPLASVTSSGLFAIRPLEWLGGTQDWQERYEARVPMGSYYVERPKEDCEPTGEWGGWKWGYCFDEYYDEMQTDCASLEEGKRLAWEEWQKRIMPALVSVANAGAKP